MRCIAKLLRMRQMAYTCSHIINPRRACAARVTVVGSVCLCIAIQHFTYSSTNDATYLTGNEGQKICGIFSVTTVFVSYGVKHGLKSRSQMTTALTRFLLLSRWRCQKQHVG